jgi:hypothetical protein
MATRKASTSDTPEPSTAVAKTRALDEMNPEIIAQATNFTEDDLRNLTDFDEAVRLTQQTLGEPVAVASKEIGDGFALIDDKTQLVGVPMLLMEWTFRDGDFGTYVSVRGMTESGKKFIINDGSTGIAEDLAKFTERTGRLGGLLVAKGLRVSEYPTGADGQPLDKATVKEHPDLVKGKGITFYLNTSS